jgi:hypothetical protein
MSETIMWYRIDRMVDALLELHNNDERCQVNGFKVGEAREVRKGLKLLGYEYSHINTFQYVMNMNDADYVYAVDALCNFYSDLTGGCIRIIPCRKVDGSDNSGGFFQVMAFCNHREVQKGFKIAPSVVEKLREALQLGANAKPLVRKCGINLRY